MKDERVMFIAEYMQTICLDDHFFAYEVAALAKPHMLHVLDVNDLTYYKPFDLLMSYDKNDCRCYVVPYCVLLNCDS